MRAELPKHITVGDLEATQGEIADAYPQKRAVKKFEAEVQLDVGLEVSSGLTVKDLTVAGYWFTSQDEKQVVQFRLDGFTFSRLRPYDRWETFFPEALRLWRIYRKRCQPERIRRLATRYINWIKVPRDPSLKDSLGMYFQTPPPIPGGGRAGLEDFFSRATLRFLDGDEKAVVTLAGGLKTVSLVPVLLDIDVYVGVELVPASDDETLIKVMERLHDLKNDIFNSVVTERAKEDFRRLPTS